MKEWVQDNDGRWRLTIESRSIALSPGFVLEHVDTDVISLVNDGTNSSCWVIYKNIPARDFVEDSPEFKRLGDRKILGVSVLEFAPTTVGGRAKHGVRMYVVELNARSSLMIVGDYEEYARPIVEQWAGQRANL